MRLKAALNQPSVTKVVVWASREQLHGGWCRFHRFCRLRTGRSPKVSRQKAISNRLADQTNQRKGKQLSTAPVTSTRCP